MSLLVTGKYNFSMFVQCFNKLECPRTVAANLFVGNAIVRILNIWPKTKASNSVGLKLETKSENPHSKEECFTF